MHSSVMVDVPVPRAWEVITEANRWPDWAEVCSEVWDVPDRTAEWGPGHQFGFRLKMAKRNIPFNVTVTRYEQNQSAARLIEWTSTKFSITAARTISVTVGSDPESTGCTVSDRKLFSSPFLPIGLAYPRLLIRRMTESWLGDLKREAESGR